jgi:hypothetical protein
MFDISQMRALFGNRSERFFVFGRKTPPRHLEAHAPRFAYGVGMVGRWFRDLKHRSLEGDGVVLSHGAVLLKTQACSI